MEVLFDSPCKLPVSMSYFDFSVEINESDELQDELNPLSSWGFPTLERKAVKKDSCVPASPPPAPEPPLLFEFTHLFEKDEMLPKPIILDEKYPPMMYYPHTDVIIESCEEQPEDDITVSNPTESTGIFGGEEKYNPITENYPQSPTPIRKKSRGKGRGPRGPRGPNKRKPRQSPPPKKRSNKKSRKSNGGTQTKRKQQQRKRKIRKKGSKESAQKICCINKCNNLVRNRLRFSLRCHTEKDFKSDFIKKGFDKVCHYHYFSDLYQFRKPKRQKEKEALRKSRKN